MHVYALKSNHIHLVVTGREDGAVSRLLQHVTGPVDSAWSSAAAHCDLAATMPEWLELEALHSQATSAA